MDSAGHFSWAITGTEATAAVAMNVMTGCFKEISPLEEVERTRASYRANGAEPRFGQLASCGYHHVQSLCSTLGAGGPAMHGTALRYS